MLRSCADQLKGCARQSKRALGFCLCATTVLIAAFAILADLHAQQPRFPSPPNQAGLQIIRTQATDDVRRPLPGQIASMPTAQEKLEVIHHRSQYIVARNNIVRTAIADSTILEVVQYSPTEISVLGVGTGTTTLHLWFENSAEPLIYLVNVIRDPGIEEQKRIDYGKLERKLAVLFPNSKVYLIPLSGKIVVKGQAANSEEAAQILSIVRGEVINQSGSLGGPQPNALPDTTVNINRFDLSSRYIINMLQVPGEFQVMLRVRIAELSRSQLRTFGINLSYLLNNGRHVLTSSLGGIPSTLTGIFEAGEISVLINWLASNGTIKILSEPTLTVLSGHSADFLSGGEFAVPTIVGIGGAQGQSTTFRGFGTSLSVTPTVMEKDLIRMRIVPEFSQVNNGNSVGGIPGVDARRVDTTVQLREGQTIVIGGLLARQTSTEITRIPFLGDIPVIGPRLFSAKRATEDETELLILVTPELVRPMDGDEVPPVPGYYITHPHDHELWKHAATEGAPDTGVYQLQPLGRGTGHGEEVGYRLFEPTPASPMYSPVPRAPNAGGYPAQQPGYGSPPANRYQPQPPGNYGGPQQPGLRPAPQSFPGSQNQNFLPQQPGYPGPSNSAPNPYPSAGAAVPPAPLGPSASRSRWLPGFGQSGPSFTRPGSRSVEQQQVAPAGFPAPGWSR